LRRTSPTTAAPGESPVIARRARAPRKNSWATLATTNAPKPNIRYANTCWVTPETNVSNSRVPSPTPTGNAKLRLSLAGVTRRHAMIGPIPESATTIRARGTTKWANTGGPTDVCVPVIASEMSGKKVSQNTTAASATSTMFWIRNTPSRETSESSRWSLLRPARR
jgi:hypothetical protein